MNRETSQNRLVLKKLVFITVLMFAFGYALIPFYKKICEVTGINKDKVTVSNTQVDPARWVTIEFDANAGAQLPWKFEPMETSLRVNPGQMKQVMYRVVNLTDRTIVGQAIPS